MGVLGQDKERGFSCSRVGVAGFAVMEKCGIQTPEVCNSEPKDLQDWGVGYPRSSSGLRVLERGVSSLEPGDERERGAPWEGDFEF